MAEYDRLKVEFTLTLTHTCTTVIPLYWMQTVMETKTHYSAYSTLNTTTLTLV